MSNTVEEVIDALRRHKNVLLYGPPGTGKTHLMSEVARRFTTADATTTSSAVLIDTDLERSPFVTAPVAGVVTRWTTFHQGYSYEDFILGLRPQTQAGGLFSLTPKPGILLELVAEANGGAGLLLIDEINRGNASRIFGEFITLMEPDKRLSYDGNPTPRTVTVTLPYLAPSESVAVSTQAGVYTIPRFFRMPQEIYLLASMNSVDKSIAPIDTALRRRFHIINLSPDFEDLQNAVGVPAGDKGELVRIGGLSSSLDVARLAVALIAKVNRGIGVYIGPDFMLGQWYLPQFAKLDFETAKSALLDTWLFRVLPQLLELFHGRSETLVTMLELYRVPMLNKSGLNRTGATPDEEDQGASVFITMASPPPSGANVLEYMQHYVGALETDADSAPASGPPPNPVAE